MFVSTRRETVWFCITVAVVTAAGCAFVIASIGVGCAFADNVGSFVGSVFACGSAACTLATDGGCDGSGGCDGRAVVVTAAALALCGLTTASAFFVDVSRRSLKPIVVLRFGAF